MTKEQTWQRIRNHIHANASKNEGVMLMAPEVLMLSEVLSALDVSQEDRVTRLAFLERQLQQVRLKVRHVTQELDY